MGDYKQILKRVWNDSKLSFVILLKTLSFLLIFSYFRLGNNVLKRLKQKLERSARVKYQPTGAELMELEWFAVYATDIFKFATAQDLRDSYRTYTGHTVGEFRECRYSIMRQGHKVFVSIRGSTTEQNWIDGLTAEMSSGNHAGYHAVAKGIADAIGRYADGGDVIYITGGSMGGAVSILAGWLLSDRGYTLGKIWAFANPRVSQHNYGHLPIINVFDMRDPVVYMPSFTLIGRYQHQGKRLVYIDQSWWLYQDCWRTDLLLSPWFMSEPLKPETHMQYGDRLLELKERLQ